MSSHLDSKVQVYTGDGKGKTTAAFGLALRAAGRGMDVLIIQFLKRRDTGERIAAEKIGSIEVENYGSQDFIVDGEVKEEDEKEVIEGFKRAEDALKEDWDMIILDEINLALYFDIISLDDVLSILKLRDDKELVLTGRNAPDEIIEEADLVTEMKKIKHYYEENIGAREGIEY